MAIVYLNGKCVPEERAMISVLDRGFLYGDGLFETLLLWGGKPFAWDAHWRRLEAGAAALHLELTVTSHEVREQAEQLSQLNHMPRCALRLTVSRGTGVRGLSIRTSKKPTIVMTLHALPVELPSRLEGWTLWTAPFRLGSTDPLAGLKTASRLVYVLAKHAAEAAGADEALLLNERRMVIEASSANLFWVRAGHLYTPPLTVGALPGITREWVCQYAQQQGWNVSEVEFPPEALERAEGVFLTFSTRGVVEARSVDRRPLSRSPQVRQLFEAYWRQVRADCPEPQLCDP